MNDNRVLPLEGVHNFRDYGGYPLAGGGRIKRGVLWRSGQHVDATEADLAALDRLELAHVIDFRGASERSHSPCRRPDGFAAQVHFYDGETTSRLQTVCSMKRAHTARWSGSTATCPIASRCCG